MKKKVVIELVEHFNCKVRYSGKERVYYVYTTDLTKESQKNACIHFLNYNKINHKLVENVKSIKSKKK